MLVMALCIVSCVKTSTAKVLLSSSEFYYGFLTVYKPNQFYLKDTNTALFLNLSFSCSEQLASTNLNLAFSSVPVLTFNIFLKSLV